MRIIRTSSYRIEGRPQEEPDRGFNWREYAARNTLGIETLEEETQRDPTRKTRSKHKPRGTPLGDIPPSQLKRENIPLEENYFYPALLLLYKQLQRGSPDPDLENFIRSPFKVDTAAVTPSKHALKRYHQRITGSNEVQSSFALRNPATKDNMARAIRAIIGRSEPAGGNASLMTMRHLNNIQRHPECAELPVVHLSDGQWVIPVVKDGTRQIAVTIYRRRMGRDEDED